MPPQRFDKTSLKQREILISPLRTYTSGCACSSPFCIRWPWIFDFCTALCTVMQWSRNCANSLNQLSVTRVHLPRIFRWHDTFRRLQSFSHDGSTKYIEADIDFVGIQSTLGLGGNNLLPPQQVESLLPTNSQHAGVYFLFIFFIGIWTLAVCRVVIESEIIFSIAFSLSWCPERRLTNRRSGYLKHSIPWLQKHNPQFLLVPQEPEEIAV